LDFLAVSVSGGTFPRVEFTEVASRPELGVWSVSCAGHGGWAAPSARADFRLVLVRRGRFRRRVAGLAVDLDPTVAYVGAPDEEESFAHPSGGDVCTSVSMSAALGDRLTGAARPLVYVDARIDLAHRRLLASAADADYGLTEALLAVLATAPLRPRPGDLALVTRAREAILANDPAAGGLLSLAAALHVSPYRLSRAFTGVLGVSLTRFRNRVRVGRVLERLEAGEQNLAGLAADLGFADQAHLCRTVRAHTGDTPTGLRAAEDVRRESRSCDRKARPGCR
jgi:AraC-like DNA-binding protein